MSKITFFGTGYVGLVTGTCFADFGNEVICVDSNPVVIDKLNKGEMTIYEPGLEELVSRNVDQKRLSFTTDSEKGVKESDILFIAVGTPPKDNDQADLKYVMQVADTIGKHMNNYKVVVNKSTVPVGTAERVKRRISNTLEEKIIFDIVSNPEFLREGAAIKDFQNPDRVVLGVDSESAKNLMSDLYAPVARTQRPIIFTDVKSAELTKYAANAMLATRISLMNEMSHLCEEVGADIKEVAECIGLDSRIG